MDLLSLLTCSTIDLRAIESVRRMSIGGSQSSDVHQIELFASSLTLWDATAATTSSAPPPTLPSTLPFSFPLTPDLPHCIHLAQSGLEYRLEARLHSGDPARLSDAVKAIPVHLSRYTRPGPLLPQLVQECDATGPKSFSLQPHTWTVHGPTLMYVQLARTLFRRAEPMEIRVRIPPPEQRMVTEKGLRLRAVEADLVRIIMTKGGTQEELVARAAGSHAETGWVREKSDKGKELLPSGGDDAGLDEIRSAIDRMPPTPPASSSSPLASYDSSETVGQGSSRAAEDASLQPDASGSTSHSSPFQAITLPPETRTHEALLAHSGKLCRFHSRRPILLRLALHPPFDSSNMPHPHPDHDALSSGPVYGRGGGGGCESISQETLFHEVKFEVRVRIAMTGGQGERRDVQCSREVRVLPGAAGDLESSSTEKTGTLGGEAVEEDPNQSASGSALDATEQAFAGFASEEEYDGYEDIGGGSPLRYASELDNEDGAGPSGGGGYAQRERDLELLRRLVDEGPDDPPPTLLESEHDLQVEVEVEGVGLAMPRAPRTPQNEHDPPPPLSPFATNNELRDYTPREDGHMDDFDPPPPLSPEGGGPAPSRHNNILQTPDYAQAQAQARGTEHMGSFIENLAPSSPSGPSRPAALARNYPLESTAPPSPEPSTGLSESSDRPPPHHSPPRSAYTPPAPNSPLALAAQAQQQRGHSLHQLDTLSLPQLPPPGVDDHTGPPDSVEPPPYVDATVRPTSRAALESGSTTPTPGNATAAIGLVAPRHHAQRPLPPLPPPRADEHDVDIRPPAYAHPHENESHASSRPHTTHEVAGGPPGYSA